MKTVWVCEDVGVEHGFILGLYASKNAALARLEEEHKKALERGEIMEKYEREKNSTVWEVGYWLPTAILVKGGRWYFKKTQGSIADEVRVYEHEVEDPKP